MRHAKEIEIPVKEILDPILIAEGVDPDDIEMEPKREYHGCYPNRYYGSFKDEKGVKHKINIPKSDVIKQVNEWVSRHHDGPEVACDVTLRKECIKVDLTRSALGHTLFVAFFAYTGYAIITAALALAAIITAITLLFVEGAV